MSNIVRFTVEGLTFGRVDGTVEPRILDVELAERLGYARPRKIRDLIARLVREGKLSDSDIRPTGGRGFGARPATEYWLTQAQALKVIAKSETDIADSILDEVIRIFILARNGGLRSESSIDARVVLLLEDVQSRLRALEGKGCSTISVVESGCLKAGMRTVAALRVTGKLNPSFRSAHRWMMNKLQSVARWSGAGRTWDMLPSDRYGDTMAELGSLRKEAQQAADRERVVKQGTIFELFPNARAAK